MNWSEIAITENYQIIITDFNKLTNYLDDCSWFEDFNVKKQSEFDLKNELIKRFNAAETERGLLNNIMRRYKIIPNCINFYEMDNYWIARSRYFGNVIIYPLTKKRQTLLPVKPVDTLDKNDLNETLKQFDLWFNANIDEL